MGKLDRTIEFLPTDDMLLECKNAGEGLTPPELALLLAYVKISLCERLLASELPDEPYMARTLANYFPSPMRTAFPAAMANHRLRCEIVTTEFVNGMINRAGISFVFRMRQETGATDADLSHAYVIAREIFALPRLWIQIESLDNRVSADIQSEMLLDGRKLVERAVRWIIRNRPRPLSIAGYGPSLERLGATLIGHVGEEERAAAQARSGQLVTNGVPEDLAIRIAMLTSLSSGLDLVEVAFATNIDTDKVAGTYFGVGEHLELHWLRDRIADLPRDTHWQAMARVALRDDLYEVHRHITMDVLHGATSDGEAGSLVANWAQRNPASMQLWSQIVRELLSGPAPDFIILSVVMGKLRGLVQAAHPGSTRQAAEQTEFIVAAAGFVPGDRAMTSSGELRK